MQMTRHLPSGFLLLFAIYGLQTVAAPPAEVPGNAVFLEDGRTLSWSSVVGASSYNIYRGTEFASSDHVCRLTGTGSLTAAIRETPEPLNAIFYFLMIRPESKKRKDRMQMIDSLQHHDKVVTIGGLYGEVQDVHEDRVVLRIADNIKVEVAKSAISGKRE